MPSIEEIAREYWKTEQTRDLDATLAFFHPDAVWEGPGSRLVGPAAISRFYRDSGTAFPGLEVTVGGVYGAPNEAAIEWSAVLVDPSGNHHPLRGVNVMQSDGQQITKLRAYFDRVELDLGVR